MTLDELKQEIIRLLQPRLPDYTVSCIDAIPQPGRKFPNFIIVADAGTKRYSAEVMIAEIGSLTASSIVDLFVRRFVLSQDC